MAIEGKGRCPLCYRWITDTDPVKARIMGDKRAHLCHKKCVDAKDNPPEVEQLSSFVPSIDVVITPDEKIPTGSNYISTTADEPSMPTKEQTGTRRKTRKATDED
jgi:hypothetical protein